MLAGVLRIVIMLSASASGDIASLLFGAYDLHLVTLYYAERCAEKLVYHRF